MNVANENQHWISQHLLKRLKTDGAPFQCYQVETGEWIPKGLERTCAAHGYNQLLVSGAADNTLESAFSKVESGLRNTFRALEDAATRPMTKLPQSIYSNLCWYCSFLKGVAPYSKPGAVVSFTIQLNMELENGSNSLFRDLSIPEETVRELRRQCSLGRKVIIKSEKLLQLLYRFQFARNYQCDYSQFLSTKWAVASSSIEFPMSDVGLVPMVLEDHKANHYLLPIGPNLLLEGVFFHDLSKNLSRPVMRGMNLTEQEAEYRFDCICASAITEIICARKLANIPEARDRANANGTRFCKIPDAKRAISSGLTDVGYSDFVFRIVSVEEYVKFVHEYMLPWNKPVNLIA
ncbi:MAG TPA: DUF4238 domain-containing protein [Verrucomicrobiota bacterium]|nr:DUF4238 domain-containing protein [Verrucomicrobiota bacterium]HNT13355.1 DUF4238 domain-containing protein [Verrucomicrobiota bacterium]